MIDYSKIDSLKKRIDEAKPFDKKIKQLLYDKFKLELNYSNNTLINNRLNYAETLLFLQKEITSEGKSLNDYLLLRNFNKAYDYINESIINHRDITEKFIKELHNIICFGIDFYEIGENYQKIKVKVDAGYFENEQLREEVNKLLSWYMDRQKLTHPIELSAQFFNNFIKIKPFKVFSEIIGSLILNFILIRADYAPCIFRVDEIDEVKNAINFATTKDYTILLEIIIKHIENSLEMVLNVLIGKIALNREELIKRLDLFADEIKVIDENIGKTSKNVSYERDKTVPKLLSIIENFISDIFRNRKTDEFEYDVNYRVRMEDIPTANSVAISDLIEQNKIFPLNTPIGSRFTDYYEIGTSIVIKIVTRRKYIPTSYLTISIMPTKYSICLISSISYAKLVLDEEKNLPNKDNTALLLEGSAVFTDWVDLEIEQFLINSMNLFLSKVEKEIEERKKEIL